MSRGFFFSASFELYSTMAAKPIMLYTTGTPSGRKASVAYGVEYEISKNTQKEPWYIALNPNGRIPVISGAILLYLQEHFDKENRFSFDAKAHPKEHSQVLQWVFWANAGLVRQQGPMMASGHFLNAKEKIPYAQNRYIDETKRLFGVLEIGLKDREYLVGGKFSIADISSYTWVAGYKFCGVESLDAWPNMKVWFDKIADREATKAGYLVP
ncbi:glutathione S-transferase [Mycena sp. CBHHK59/15]|nr:glutathione S-transferase [Mycena sp. CBHHK59/15]